jgi:2-oxoglutarate dehydrogenase E1 component
MVMTLKWLLMLQKLHVNIETKFKKDIIIDLFCYRRRGHNEADDPSATQPLMYKKISEHPSVLKQYEEVLLSKKVLTNEKIKSTKTKYRKSLEGGKTVAKNLAEKPNNSLWFDWDPYLDTKWWPKG